MKESFSVSDGRMIARIINLAHQFNCSYHEVTARRENGGFTATIDLIGADDALRRLKMKLTAILSCEGELQK